MALVNFIGPLSTQLKQAGFSCTVTKTAKDGKKYYLVQGTPNDGTDMFYAIQFDRNDTMCREEDVDKSVLPFVERTKDERTRRANDIRTR